MQQNVGGIDKTMRIVLGVALIALTLTGTINAWGWLGLIPLLTGVFNFCPVYALFKINTCK